MSLPLLKVLQWLPSVLGIKLNFLTTVFWVPRKLSSTHLSQFCHYMPPFQNCVPNIPIFFLFLFLQGIKYIPASGPLHLQRSPLPRATRLSCVGRSLHKLSQSKGYLFLIRTKKTYRLEASLI